MKKVLIILFFSTFSVLVYAQQDEHDVFHAHHTLGLMISHTQISQGVQADGHRKWLSLPSWGLNYNYKFSEKWAVGLHTDIVTEDFEVEEYAKSGTDGILQRSYPIAIAAMGSFKPGKHFSFLLGAGGEFSHTANYALIRVGVEYGYEFAKSWELNANITNDVKINAYNSWAIGLGVTKIF